jgi:hypothetical protein
MKDDANKSNDYDDDKLFANKNSFIRSNRPKLNKSPIRKKQLSVTHESDEDKLDRVESEEDQLEERVESESDTFGSPIGNVKKMSDLNYDENLNDNYPNDEIPDQELDNYSPFSSVNLESKFLFLFQFFFSI